MLSTARKLLNAVWPRGPFWEPTPGDYYDNLLEGMADNSEVVKQDMQTLQHIRCPQYTPILSDLEKELGVIPVTGATEDERRQTLFAFDNRIAGSGNWEGLQSQLREAGFTDVFVSQNDPPVDPRIFIEQSFNMICDDVLPSGNDAQCGEPEAICAEEGGFLVVNGSILSNVPNYLNQCDETGIECGEPVYAGDFDGYRNPEELGDYTIPADTGYWGLIFFVSGAVTRDPVTNEITNIDNYTVPAERKSEFIRTILKYKPQFSWAACVVQFN